MDAFSVYKMYLGIKAHFKSKSYDYIKYGDVKAKYTTFSCRSDRYFFEKIGKKYKDEELKYLFISNFIINENIWIGDFLDSNVESNYIAWRKRNESLEYNFEQDMDKVCSLLEEKGVSFDEMFACKPNEHPLILRLLLQKEINPETFAILDSLLHFSKQFNNKIPNDIVWNAIFLKYHKYNMFLESSYKKDVLRKIILNKAKFYCLTERKKDSVSLN